MLLPGYKTQAEIPEGLTDHYKEKDGMWALDGYVSQSKIDEFRSNNRTLAKDKEALQSQLLKFKDIDPEKYAEAVTKLQELEDARLLEKGEFGTLKAKMEQDHADKMKAEKAKTKNVQETLDGERIDNATARIVLQNALPEEGNMRYVQADIREAASIDPETGKVVFLDDKGLKIKNDDGELLSHEEFIKTYIPKSNLFKKSTGGGAMGATDIPMVSAGQVKIDNVSGKDISGGMLADLASGKVSAVD